MVAGEPQTTRKSVKRSHDGEMKKQTIDKNMLDNEGSGRPRPSPTFKAQARPGPLLLGLDPSLMLDFGEMAAMVAAMAERGTATPQLEDFGGEKIPDCCQEQIRLLLDLKVLPHFIPRF